MIDQSTTRTAKSFIEELALGVCENDPELPDTVMISVNASLLAHQPEVIRSTAAHEFAHAIFDMPAAMGGNIRRTFRTSVRLGRMAAAVKLAQTA